MTFKPKLVAFDLDGTLAESKQRVSAQMGELISRLLEVMPVAIMSGASFKQFETQLLPALPASEAQLKKLYLFPVNAAMCFVFKQEKWQAQYDHSFNSAERGRIILAIHEALEETGLVNIPERKKEWGEQIEDRGAQIAFSMLGQQAPLEAKQEQHRTHEDARDRFREALTRRLPDFSILEGGLTTLDITKKGVSKAYGIRRLIEFTSISVSEMLYVGDALQEGGNDAVVVQT
ncbi:MAG: HAD-IIB family hydrolase, partial [Patescibacteria group bacterium]|nr:HAD-IIB family hydrolase [Patescibacteria group bacterium]